MKSVVSYPDRGSDGKNYYRGNCSGKLIEDIIKQYQLPSLSDFMVGGGTTEDVCRRMKIPGYYTDLNKGFDMVAMDMPERSENIFWHPPYDSIITYSDNMYSAKEIQSKFGFDPIVNDLSRCNNWSEFVKKMNYCMLKQFSALEKGGRMFVLMGDIKKKGRLYSMISEIAKPGILEQIIIKMQYNCWSDNKNYSGKFVPIVHEYLMVVKKDSAIIYPVLLTKQVNQDIRDSSATWRDVVAAILEDANEPMPLDAIYANVEGHKKTESNRHWKEKVRQTLQSHTCFSNVERGVWKAA